MVSLLVSGRSLASWEEKPTVVRRRSKNSRTLVSCWGERRVFNWLLFNWLVFNSRTSGCRPRNSLQSSSSRRRWTFSFFDIPSVLLTFPLSFCKTSAIFMQVTTFLRALTVHHERRSGAKHTWFCSNTTLYEFQKPRETQTQTLIEHERLFRSQNHANFSKNSSW